MKKIKVFFMGRRLCDIYPHATKFQVFKYRVRNFFRKATIFAMFCALIAGSYKLGGFVSPRTILAENQVQVDSLPAKLESLKMGLVDSLAKCESAGLTEDDGIIIFDTNNKASIGPLQFQKKTVIYYEKSLYSKDITAKQAVEIALDKDESYALAKDIIFTTDSGLKNWINCGNKLGLRAQVDIINKLSK